MAWVAAVGIGAAVALPVLVYYTGDTLLGPYSGGGLRDFVSDYLADLARGRAGAWTLLLGPAALVIAWRAVVALAWPGSSASGAQRPAKVPPPAPPARRDPTIGGFNRG